MERDESSSKHIKCGSVFWHAASTKNFVFSPFAAESAYNLLLLAAGGATAKQMRDSLQQCKCSPDEISTFFRNSINALTSDRTSYELCVGNKFSLNNFWPLRNEYKNVAKHFFSTEFTYIFSNEVPDLAWQCTSFNGSSSWHNVKLFVQSDAYLKAEWRAKFFSTNKDLFHTSTGRNTVSYLLDFMTSRWIFGFYDFTETNSKVVELKFKGQEASMFIIIPDEMNNLGGTKNLIAKTFLLSHDKFKPRLIDLTLPRFQISTKFDFRELFAMLVMDKVITDGKADFSRMTGEKRGLDLNGFFQETCLTVDVHGVKTHGIGFHPEACEKKNSNPAPSSSLEITVNRPFAFFIKVKGFMVFSGKYLGPSGN